MSKLEITDVQIDNYNDTNNKLNRYQSGLNIIIGDNEAGKSTLMSFVKNIFVRKSDAKGYIKCSIDGQTVQLYAQKTKRKENEQFLGQITAHTYQTGFIIDLDDVVYSKKADAEELINTIKDSSGNAVNRKQNELNDYIYGKKQDFSLTGTNKASKPFIEQFEILKNIEREIKDLQTKEEEYNSICLELDNLETGISHLNELYSCTKILREKEIIKKELKNLKVNQKLLDNRTNFENLRRNYGALYSAKSKLSELNSRLKEFKEKYSQKFSELIKLENLSEEQISKFDLNTDDLKLSRQILEKEKELNAEINSINNNIEIITKRTDSLSNRIDEINTEQTKIHITDIETYSDDKLLLENYLLNYTKLSDNYRNSDVKTQIDKDNNSILFILMFSGILFMSIGCLISYIHQPVRLFFITLILISIAGINTGIMEKIKNKKNRLKTDCVKEIEKNKLQILRIYNKYNFAENAENDFTVQANCNIQKMNYNISEYKRLSYDLLKLSTELKTETENLIKSKELLNSAKDKLKNLIEEKESFLKKVSIEKLENYPEIYEFARELKNICVSVSETEKSILDTDKMSVNFARELNDFLQTCEIDETVNKYDNFEDILDKIRDSLDKSLENNRLKTELISKINTYDNELVKYSDEIKAKIAKSGTINPEETELVLKTKQEEKGKLTRSKEILEQVSNLVELKNRRNVEINRLKSCLNRLIVKEVVLMMIEKSKEKFNETQPNLISAKKYLSKITNGKYNEINFENKSISGVNMPEKDWDTLSRGTKEQLYLALRLGFADNYSKDIDGNFNGIPQLPLIIDDAFVNFDKSRTTAVLKCLEEFGKNNQVLYFTCHTEVIKDILKKENIKYNLIEL